MSFDIGHFTDTSHRVAVSDINFSSFATNPLSPAALRTLRYMSDVESHTICYLRDLLVTPSHKDPVVTAFLTHWAYEEFWHGEALDAVLRAHGLSADYAHIRQVRLAQGFRDRMAPIGQALAANVLGPDFVAIHMTWGAVNEWSAHAAYARMIDRERHPELSTLLRRIQRQESRHLAFYAAQARERLGRSRRARLLTRQALRRFWAPVGSGIEPAPETAFVLQYLLGGREGARLIDQIDAKIDGLPGLSGLHLVRGAVAKYGIGQRPTRVRSGRIEMMTRSGSQLWRARSCAVRYFSSTG